LKQGKIAPQREKIPELVAPAGSPAAFLAGLKAGADAFYLGVGRLNARARAQNFQLEDLERIVGVAHENARKVYLALNILMQDGELKEFIEILERAEACAVDGVIIQDLGVLYLLKRFFPGLRVHASTQMFLHNSLHIEAFAGKGISRVILPRELRLEEIRAIRGKTSVELEVFVHGALCFSFSGLCLASSFVFGESGNRGRCKQPCRFAFEGGLSRYPFAMRDLEGRTFLEALLRTRIDSLKIEGRLRNTDYVHETVAYYRECLDAFASEQPLPAPARWRFSRRTTSGYFKALPYGAMVCSNAEPWIGEPVGRVKRVSGGLATVVFRKPVFRGDRLRILREDGVNVHDFTLLDFRPGRCEVPLRGRTGMTGAWTVYRVGTSQAPRSRSLKIRQGRPKTCPVSVSIERFGNRLIVEGLLWGRLPYRASFPVETGAARRPLCEERIRDCFAKVDRSPFRVEAVSVKLAEPMSLPVRELNRIRREFYLGLEGFHDADLRERNRSRREAILREYEAIQGEWMGEGAPRIADLIPYEESAGRRCASDPAGHVWVELPLFVSEAALEAFLEDLKESLRDPRLVFVAHSLGWVDFLQPRVAGDRIASGAYLYCANRFAYRFLREQGVSWIFLSPDFEQGEIRELVRYRNVARPREPALRFFVTRQPVPPGTYRFRSVSLQVIPRRGYSEVVRALPPPSCRGAGKGGA
jgi:putative protease